MSQFNEQRRFLFQSRIVTCLKGEILDLPLRICIIEKDPFVSIDVSETFRRVVPQAECAVFSSVGEARETLDGAVLPDLIFVSADQSGGVAGSDADLAWVESRRVIAVDLKGRNERPAWFHLNKPFSQEELQAATTAALDARARVPQG
jgi:hypothetical protein